MIRSSLMSRRVALQGLAAVAGTTAIARPAFAAPETVKIGLPCDWPAAAPPEDRRGCCCGTRAQA
jgi:hypothetical protein